MTIWIDADACPKPVKEIIFKAAEKQKLKVILVANSFMHFPNSQYISLEVVAKDFNGADAYIVEKSQVGDLVISEDIPLASLLVKKNVVVITPKGKKYDEENMGDILSTRELLTQLRGGGMVSGGPAPYSANDKQAFANLFNKEVTALLQMSRK